MREAFLVYARGEWSMPPKVYVPAYPSAAPRSPATASYGYCRSHSRWFWGFRLYLLGAPVGFELAAANTPAAAVRRRRAVPVTGRKGLRAVRLGPFLLSF